MVCESTTSNCQIFLRASSNELASRAISCRGHYGLTTLRKCDPIVNVAIIFHPAMQLPKTNKVGLDIRPNHGILGAVSPPPPSRKTSRFGPDRGLSSAVLSEFNRHQVNVV